MSGISEKGEKPSVGNIYQILPAGLNRILKALALHCNCSFLFITTFVLFLHLGLSDESEISHMSNPLSYRDFSSAVTYL